MRLSRPRPSHCVGGRELTFATFVTLRASCKVDISTPAKDRNTLIRSIVLQFSWKNKEENLKENNFKKEHTLGEAKNKNTEIEKEMF